MNQNYDCAERSAGGDRTSNLEEIYELRQWLMVDHFDREQVNERLRKYATGELESMSFEQEIV